ncbi:hypothetical protein HK104_005197 [Borealophlyctis nickersoniae]|nr:hypothetical protein HK104_005197 [Borealophlyctis nickersoniae]
MAEAVLASSTSTRLLPFLLLAKSTKGAGCVKLIQDALSAPGVYVFSELLETPNVEALKSHTEHAPYYNLLELFAYGTYQEYKSHAAALPPLSDVQLKKLKHLSIVTMSGENRTLHYEILQGYLDISNVRELEDLLIDAIYQDVIKGKLDQKKKAVEVEYAMGRDLRPEQSEKIMSMLAAWLKTSDTILQTIDKQVKAVSDATNAYKKGLEDYESKMEGMKKEVKQSSQDGGRGGSHGGGSHGDGFDSRRESYHGMDFEDSHRDRKAGKG